jgi:uncharacterized protein YcgI (DUF1989 family)
MSSFVVVILVGIGVLALLAFAFRASRARRSEALNSHFVYVPESHAFAAAHDSGCGSDSAADGGGCDGGGGGD